MASGRIPSVEGGIQPTIVDAKGDLIVATAADTVNRLAVGTNNYVLTADSAETTGLKWAAAQTPAFVGVRCLKSTTTSAANNTTTEVAFDATDDFDTDGFHDPASNNTRITIPTGKGGKYLVQGVIDWAANSSGERTGWIRKNGSTVTATYNGGFPNPSPATQNTLVVAVLNLSAGDYITLAANQQSGGSLNIGTQSTFSAVFLGA